MVIIKKGIDIENRKIWLIISKKMYPILHGRLSCFVYLVKFVFKLTAASRWAVCSHRVRCSCCFSRTWATIASRIAHLKARVSSPDRASHVNAVWTSPADTVRSACCRARRIHVWIMEHALTICQTTPTRVFAMRPCFTERIARISWMHAPVMTHVRGMVFVTGEQALACASKCTPARIVSKSPRPTRQQKSVLPQRSLLPSCRWLQCTWSWLWLMPTDYIGISARSNPNESRESLQRKIRCSKSESIWSDSLSSFQTEPFICHYLYSQ